MIGSIGTRPNVYNVPRSQEERLKQRVDALRQISWCRSRAPRFDKCANITACSAKAKALAISSRKSAGAADQTGLDSVDNDGKAEGWNADRTGAGEEEGAEEGETSAEGFGDESDEETGDEGAGETEVDSGEVDGARKTRRHG